MASQQWRTTDGALVDSDSVTYVRVAEQAPGVWRLLISGETELQGDHATEAAAHEAARALGQSLDPSTIVWARWRQSEQQR